jgi:group II intron reverse transcriptase/maturase
MQSEDLFKEQRILNAAKAVVHRTHAGQVRYDWLSACEEERALTAGIMEEVISPLNLLRSYRKVVSNAGSAGVDGMTVKELGKWLRENFTKLQEQLINGKYVPQPVRNVEIPKPNGGHRQLGIPTVIDRLVQQAIHQVLSPRYERVFSEYSYGFRPERSAHDALEKASQYVAEGYRYVIDLDLEKFFDKVNHDRLMWMLGTRIGDRRLLTLIGKYLHGGVLKDGLVEQRTEGTPQGSPL